MALNGLNRHNLGILLKHFLPSCPNLGRREKIKLSFYFHTFCGASKGFMKALYILGPNILNASSKPNYFYIHQNKI